MYSPTHKCPYCGSTNIYAYQNLSLTSMPTTWQCYNCQKEFQNAIPLTAGEALQPQYNHKIAKYGWICPNCGVGVNPSEKFCPKCDSANKTTISVGRTDVDVLSETTQTNIEILKDELSVSNSPSSTYNYKITSTDNERLTIATGEKSNLESVGDVKPNISVNTNTTTKATPSIKIDQLLGNEREL